MRKLITGMLALGAHLGGLAPGVAAAQGSAQPLTPVPPQETAPAAAGQGAPTFCGTTVAPPAQLPPPGSPPVLWIMGPCFQAQGNVSTVEAQTYLYYMQLRP